jgi:hypothetical protein
MIWDMSRPGCYGPIFGWLSTWPHAAGWAAVGDGRKVFPIWRHGGSFLYRTACLMPHASFCRNLAQSGPRINHLSGGGMFDGTIDERDPRRPTMPVTCCCIETRPARLVDRPPVLHQKPSAFSLASTVTPVSTPAFSLFTQAASLPLASG